LPAPRDTEKTTWRATRCVARCGGDSVRPDTNVVPFGPCVAQWSWKHFTSSLGLWRFQSVSTIAADWNTCACVSMVNPFNEYFVALSPVTTRSDSFGRYPL